MRALWLAALLAVGSLIPLTSMEAQSRGGRGAGTDSARWHQADMDRRIQERMGQILRQQLRLSDAQVRQMQDHMRQYGPRRMSLGRDERQVRERMREAMATRDSVGSPDLPRMLDRILELQRTRVDLMHEEQRALAQFLSPLQRARYMAFEEELQRRSEEMRRAAERGAGRGGPGGPPPRDSTGTTRRGG
jgi:hypothetical protein